jgi:hypothetical protein
MRKNKTGGRKNYGQRIIEPAKRKDGTPNPKAGKVKNIAHRIVAND